MQGWVAALAIVVAVASRPIEVRLWRAGRMSDRTMAVFLVGRLPVLVAVFAILDGASWMLVATLTVIGLVPSLVMYRFVLDVVRQRASERQSN